MLLVSAHAAGTFRSGNFPSRMFLCLKMGKEFQLFLACISLGGDRVRTSQIQQDKCVSNQQGAGTKIPPFSLPIVTPSLLPVRDASSVESMVYWPCCFRGGHCDTNTTLLQHIFQNDFGKVSGFKLVHTVI